jgi:hypothetical protein
MKPGRARTATAAARAGTAGKSAEAAGESPPFHVYSGRCAVLPLMESMAKVYFEGVDASITRDDLRKFFTQVGEVRSVFLVTDKVTRVSRGFGCVDMATAKDAAHAANSLKHFLIKGGNIRIHPPSPPRSAKQYAR